MKRLLTDIDCCCCFIAFFSVIQAIPVKDSGAEGLTDNRTSLENVCVHENAIYKAGQNFSTGNPCETCVCDPPGVSCSLRSCDLKAGCKAIHKANRCCPEYVCECERNGKIYGNGEKVEEPNPCKVCYCKGGEIKCALVTCYTRDDCEPGYVAGVCCPKYDHCPPLEMNNNSTSTAPALVIVSDLKTESAIKMVPPVYLATSTPYSSTAVTETTAFFESTAEETETTEPELNATTEASTEFTTEDPTTEWTTESVTTELPEETTTTEESTTSTIAAEERKADVVEESTTTDVPETTPEYTTTIITEEPTTETTEEFNSTEVFTTEFTTTELITTTEGYAESTERPTTTTEPTTTTTTTPRPRRA
ncbi:UNVERIFIED_CONTAM: hypothetical protein PYX00_005447 [Menopon gallinae]|uniref:VWFC domain-containing protein n=1 Tax=Menopon gallinae TaxID=328185 RepID=A0AAW2HT30_9NEOP